MVTQRAQTATHKHVNSCTVKFAKTKDFLKNEIYRVVFENGEVTTMPTKRFNDLFAVN